MSHVTRDLSERVRWLEENAGVPRMDDAGQYISVQGTRFMRSEDVILVGSGGSAPAFNTGWGIGFGGAVDATPGFYKDPFGRIHLSGAATRSSGSSTTIFTLPAGYRPSVVRRFATDANDAHARVNVTSAGAVNLLLGSTTNVSLDGISFRAT